MNPLQLEEVRSMMWSAFLIGMGNGITIGWVIGAFTAILCLESDWRWWRKK